MKRGLSQLSSWAGSFFSCGLWGLLQNSWTALRLTRLSESVVKIPSNSIWSCRTEDAFGDCRKFLLGIKQPIFTEFVVLPCWSSWLNWRTVLFWPDSFSVLQQLGNVQSLFPLYVQGSGKVSFPCSFRVDHRVDRLRCVQRTFSEQRWGSHQRTWKQPPALPSLRSLCFHIAGAVWPCLFTMRCWCLCHRDSGCFCCVCLGADVWWMHGCVLWLQLGGPWCSAFGCCRKAGLLEAVLLCSASTAEGAAVVTVLLHLWEGGMCLCSEGSCRNVLSQGLKIESN